MKTDTGACAGTPELNESFQGLTARACPESDAVRRTAPAAEHPEKVKELISEQIAAGRNTPAPPRRQRPRTHRSLPRNSTLCLAQATLRGQ